MAQPVYGRVVVKLSGEALAGPAGFGVDQSIVETIAADIAASRRLGVEIALVVGGGNIFRGVEVSNRGVSRPTGDTMGMLATVMNSLVHGGRHRAPRRAGGDAVLDSDADGLRSLFAAPRARSDRCRARRAARRRHRQSLFHNRYHGGPARPPNSTATPCSRPPMSTASTTPTRNRTSSARRYDRLSPREALERNLKVMDSTAFALARENGMPIIVFSIREPGAIEAVLRGKGRATIVAD